MYRIGELSKLCNLSVKTLRFYDSEGLLVPDEIDKFTGYRYYSASKLNDCYRIIALKELGFNLSQIKAQLATDDHIRTDDILDAKLAELNALIEKAQGQAEKIERLKNELAKGESKMYHVIIRATDEIRVAFVRKIFCSKADALNEMAEMANRISKAIVGKRKVLINYESEYKESEFDLAVCVEIAGALPSRHTYDIKTISFRNEVASLCCQEDEMNDAYKAIIQYLDGSDYKVCGAYYEIYHSDGTAELKVPVCKQAEEPFYNISDSNEPFVDDPEVCGKWEMIDIVPTREHFVYGKPKCSHISDWLHELYFIDGGTPYWTVEGWTKGCLFTRGPEPDTKCYNKYQVEIDEGHKLLFLEMKSHGTPEVWVYEKVDDKRYQSKEEIRKCDNIDYPFVDDETVVGKWVVRDFVINKEDFDPAKQNWKQDDLFILSAEFKENGVYVTTSQNFTNSVTSFWTKGLILNKREKTASAYEIKVIDGKEYLFKEWKSGDYSFGGRKPCWYVFTR